MQNLTVISSRVRLARNYTDLPFNLSSSPESAQALIARTVSAIEAAGLRDQFHLVQLSELTENQQKMLEEEHYVSEDLLKSPETAAALLDESQHLSIMMNEEDHLRIQAMCSGEDLQKAADRVFRIDDALSREVTFAFDKDLGYLTACPTNTGTGMRASLQMHLPMLTQFKQMGAVSQIVAKVGLNIRGVYGEGSEALGNIYQISNQATLGRTEEEILKTVLAVGNQLAEKEETLRERALQENRIAMEDRVFRAQGLLMNARRMDLKEFYGLWSSLRTGMLMDMVPRKIEVMDLLLEEVQDAHLMAYLEKHLNEADLNAARSIRIRELLRAEG